MTGAALEVKMRALLRDNGDGRSTGARRYEAQDLQIALDRARMDAYKALLDASRERPPLALGKLCQRSAAADGAGVPVSYYDLECGLDSDGRYMVAEHPDVGEAFYGSGYQYVSVAGGAFKSGSALSEAISWRLPIIPILFSIGAPVLDDLPDSFYEALKYGAMRDVLKKESGDHLERWKFFDELYKRAIGSFIER